MPKLYFSTLLDKLLAVDLVICTLIKLQLLCSMAVLITLKDKIALDGCNLIDVYSDWCNLAVGIMEEE